ncbi:dihydropteroate synthase [Zunongwangia atlantica]|uniref:dihydropteroate synthase n=1 Tax=Zunongwangia atlantica 22II14-10F7 TaxID=1185767 RepID=A0A1Y1T558_9FLAO|nr:dihydropteroate synthase [Zunongwangia atlantica]ORL46181.1 dihydropteroate synthase [Zunongwangia atlantica 22II14-10F7]
MTINCKGKLIDLSSPKVMGILNITPDSFFEHSRMQNESDLFKKAEVMLKQGATFIDIGGYSSRPDANDVAEDEELNRVVPAIEILVKEFPEILISVDTFRSKVAAEAIEAGAAIINDIAAGNLDEKMMHVIAQYQVPYIMMHMRGTPKTMKQLTEYEDLVGDITYYFSEKIKEARDLGINDLILDPGFGFAKTTEQNFELLKKSDLFSSFKLPVLIGISRKTMIHKTLNIDPTEALNGTTVLNTLALTKGASILRVHDVKEAIEAIKLVSHFSK